MKAPLVHCPSEENTLGSCSLLIGTLMLLWYNTTTRTTYQREVFNWAYGSRELESMMPEWRHGGRYSWELTTQTASQRQREHCGWLEAFETSRPSPITHLPQLSLTSLSFPNSMYEPLCTTLIQTLVANYGCQFGFLFVLWKKLIKVTFLYFYY